jgi:hypothetical protein
MKELPLIVSADDHVLDKVIRANARELLRQS